MALLFADINQSIYIVELSTQTFFSLIMLLYSFFLMTFKIISFYFNYKKYL